MSGAIGERFSLPMASGRSSPDRICPITEGAGTIVTCDSPAITALKEAPAPLQGTCSALMPAMCVKSTPARWLWKPLPAFDQLSFPGFAFAYAIKSLTLLKGVLGFTTSRFWVVANKDIGAKSLKGSYVTCFL